MLGDGLSADQFGRLSRRYGSIQKAGVAAFKSGRYAEDFRLLAVQLVVDGGTERLEFFDDVSEQVSIVVWLAAEPDLEAEHAPSSASNDPPGMTQNPGPSPTFHDPTTIGMALSALPSVKAATADSGLNNKDVLRAEKMRRWKLLRWDGTTLWADPERVQQRGKQVALRVLSTDGSRWLDPLPLRDKP